MNSGSFTRFFRPALLAVVVASQLVAGCSSDVEVGSCGSFCDQMCSRMKECNVGDTSDGCASSCKQQITSGDQCSAGMNGLKTMSCDDITRAVECAGYCVSLCAKAAGCQAGFDQAACESGCASHPSKCNLASVDARDCTHVKSESECYVTYGQPHGGDVVAACGVGPGGDQGSLCGSMSDCLNDLGCDKATTTCQPCKTHDDCKNSISTYFCTPEGKCVYANCLTDDDCKSSSSGPLCRVGKCVKCGSDADCPGGKCSEYDGCVQCVEDKDCSTDSMCDYKKCWKRCDNDSQCPNADCFGNHCTAPVGTPCDPKGYSECGGASCINVSAANLTVDGYCTRSCYSTDPPCPDGTTCKDSQCRKP